MVSPPQVQGRKAHILVGDATPMQCELMASALRRERDFCVVAMASESRQLLRHLGQFEPGIAIISADLQDGPGAGLNVLAEVRSKQCRTQCVILLDRSDRKLVVAAFRRGARGIFFRAQPFEMLSKCVRTVLRGQVWVNAREMNYILDALAGPGRLPLLDGTGNCVLTQREAEVTHLVAEGLTNREIAAKMHLSEHTVKNYVFRIFEKTGVSSRVNLVLYALSQQEIRQEQTA